MSLLFLYIRTNYICMDKLRLLMKFYRNIMAVSIITAVAGTCLVFRQGHREYLDFAPILMMKLFITAGTVLYVHVLKKRQYTYYNNQGISTASLWAYTIIPDIFVFTLLMALVRIITRLSI